MTKKTKVFHGGKFTAHTVKTSEEAALKIKEELQEKGKKVRVTTTHEGKNKVKVHRVWVK